MLEIINKKRLHHVLYYDEETGIFTWKNISKYHAKKNGMRAGKLQGNGAKNYIVIGIDGHRIGAHRLAWLYIHGYMPTMIDHINGNSLDNRISNLRECTHTQNTQNHAKKINGSGLPAGVRMQPNGKYTARIKANGKAIHIGVFQTKEEASNMYIKRRKELHDAPILGEL